ncbi:MAG: DEAD/DEAH box helicase family protein [Holophagaceae bacterium]|nr:DEAD/DEAH box helicase family protein [Holophagaceae bacterium]
MPFSFDSLLSQYRTQAHSERDKGNKFERLVRGYLKTDRQYSNELKEVWLWEDFFARDEWGGKDIGIDLVAETVAGEYWAIQCKCYQDGDTVDKKHLDSFISASGKSFTAEDGKTVGFAFRLWVSTTDNWTDNAEISTRNQQPPFGRITLSHLRNSDIDWAELEKGVHGDRARKQPKQPRPYQQTAIDSAIKHFATHDRGKMIMACGTGKTFTALRIVEQQAVSSQNKLALVLVPSIALVGQILRDWTGDASTPINQISVCSDPKVTSKKEISSLDQIGDSVVDLGAPATTDERAVAREYKRYKHLTETKDRLTVIFSTYQSIQVIADAQASHSLPEFDFIVCDEAHRTTGVTIASKDEKKRDEGYFKKVHDQSFIKGKKRLYMTATERFYKEDAKQKASENDAVLCSMDDTALYGDEFYRITFGEAVDQNLLTDYKVLVLTIDESYIPKELRASYQTAKERYLAKKNSIGELPEDTLEKMLGVINALSKKVSGGGSQALLEADPAPMKRALAFCRIINDSKWYTQAFTELSKDIDDSHATETHGEMVKVEAKHIDGSMGASKRLALLDWLKSDDEWSVASDEKNSNHSSHGHVGTRSSTNDYAPQSSNCEEAGSNHSDGDTGDKNLPNASWGGSLSLHAPPNPPPQALTKHQVCKLLTNVRCLSEGVDVPALDAVIFLSPKNSLIDVVQSVGRVMRRAPGKNFGYIVIPIFVEEGQTPEQAVEDKEKFAVVWKVLNAIRTHDARLDAEINSIELNKKATERHACKATDRIFHGHLSRGNVLDSDSDGYAVAIQGQLPLTYDDSMRNAIFAQMVLKVGTKIYWQEWAKDVGEIAKHQVERITKLVQQHAGLAFEVFLAEMKDSVDATLTESDAIEILAQHTITAPVFDALFEDYKFAENNVVSKAMERILKEIEASGGMNEEDTRKLDKFYENVKMRAKGITSPQGKQAVIIELYNNFFRAAFPRLTEMLGIVYTPVEVVDFIVHSVNDVLKAEFGKSLSDEGVNILDPFTGTGTFITRLIQSGLIDKKDLPRKYQHEIFARDIVLLAYYIACVNIEQAYHDAMEAKKYTPFEGISLSDTFQTYEESFEHKHKKRVILDENTDRVQRQTEMPMTVIFGNPPYSVGQNSANDDAQNYIYPHLNRAIEGSYAALSDSGSLRSLYDSYIRAFRYSTDRLRDNDGIVCFVSNGSWLDGKATTGFRKSIENEFAKIYVFNLRGNQRTSGELSRKEGGKIFGSGSRTPVAITLLVKRAGHSGKAEIYYKDIGDYLDRETKLEFISGLKTFANPNMGLVRLMPNEYGDWITERNEEFYTHIPLAPEKKFDEQTESVFVLNSNGMNSQRDVWVWNFSREAAINNASRMVCFYNSQLCNPEPDNDPSKISWTRALRGDFSKRRQINFENDKIALALYRPFQKMQFYHGERMIEVRYRFDNIFPTPSTENRVIEVSGLGGNKDHSVFISSMITDLNCLDAGTQCFPLFYYEKNEGFDKMETLLSEALDNRSNQAGAKKKSLPRIAADVIFDMSTQGISLGYTRKDGISDYILKQATAKYGGDVSKEDIFYYVYGFLHHPKYRETFADDLKKSLPRIPLVDRAGDFWAFSKAGRQLADLHINYEDVPPLPEVKVIGNMANLHVEKMKFLAKDRKDTIIYNSYIRIENIPDIAYKYVVNGKPALEWVMERYQVKTDKDSGITNNPNDYASELGQPDYILNLLLSVIAVSVRTVGVVEGLPSL